LSETAEALGIATSTVKYRLREALDFLRAKASAQPETAAFGQTRKSL
jgi:DNA-directed RNA polymerase specialized sigma24 family protein